MIAIMTTTRYFKIVFICLWATLYFSTEGWGQFIQPENSRKEANDTVKEDNPFAVPDSLRKRRNLVNKDSLTVVNAIDYIMDTRYQAVGDSLNKPKWYRDLFLQGGMGVEKIFPPTSGYRFNTLNTFHLGIGKQFGKYHSLRLTANAALGYQQDYERMYLRIGGQLDHQFNLSSYLSGYNPSRMLEVGTIVGVGLHKAWLRGTGRTSVPYEAHAGLQLRFNTGPHGVLNIEPYVGLASDNIDLSQARNWHRYDVTFGVNANFVYYFDNHFSRAARNRLLLKMKKKNPNLVTSDSTRLYSWQAPWFFEIAGGLALTNIPELSTSEQMGHEWAVSGGKWFSPVIGVRASAMFNTTPWAKRVTTANQLEYEERLTSFYVGGRIEAMFNPFGFMRNFRWDAPVGAYIVGGAGLGWLMKHKEKPALHCWSESYSAGLHLWARLTDGLQFFIEPRYTYRVYNVPFRNVQWMSNFSDHSYGVNVGITANSISRSYRRYATPEGEHRPRMAAGLGGGLHLLPSNSNYKTVSSLPFNANAFFEYRWTNVSGVRAAFEMVKHYSSAFTKFYDLNMTLPEYNYAPMVRTGQLNYTYFFGLASVDYSLNLTNAFCGYRPGRVFEFEVFAGPGVMFTLSRKAVLDERESLRVNHEMRALPESAGKASVTINGGAKLTANVYRGLGITLTPRLYYIPNLKIHGMTLGRLKVLGTLDLGLQYQF